MKITESKLRKIIREIIREGFAGPLSKTKQKKFESDRRKNSEVLGYRLTGKSDVKAEIGLTEGVWPTKFRNTPNQDAIILEKAFKAAGVKVFKVQQYNPNDYFVHVQAVDGRNIISIGINAVSNVVFLHDMRDVKLGELKENPREIVRTLKKLKKLPGFGQSVLKKK